MKSSIGKKMTKSFAAILFFVVVALVAVLVTSNMALAKSKVLAEESFPAMQKMDHLKLSIYGRRVVYDQFFLTKKPIILKEIKKMDADIQQQIKDIKIDKEFMPLFTQYNKKFDELVVFIKENPGNLNSAMKKVAIADKYFDEKLLPTLNKSQTQKQDETDSLVKQIVSVLKNSQLIFIAIGIVILVLGFLLSGRLSKMLTTSIISLTKATDKISMGNFDTVIDVKTGDEIEDLANAIDRMKKSLQKAMERLMK
ncbi:MAG: HAMP domain-containing protein [Candidatus Cloacimonetes bacterium]|nr:HAMP domain-containing protein [Candidatus Cloacimonadota bacterium]